MRTVPFTIDNVNVKLSDVLDRLLADAAGNPFDVATAYFNVRAYELLGERLKGLGAFRLLLGHEPGGGDDLGLRPSQAAVYWNRTTEPRHRPLNSGSSSSLKRASPAWSKTPTT